MITEARPLTLLQRLRAAGDLAVKVGCEEGHCGACLVLVDGRPRYACLTLADACCGSAIETAADLADSDAGRAVIAALTSAGAVQCGYCVPGIVVALTFLIRRGGLTRTEAVEALDAHHCRCTGYYAILRAVDTLLDHEIAVAAFSNY
jgi:carbon-monoxide dehydrogenase small subunit